MTIAPQSLWFPPLLQRLVRAGAVCATLLLPGAAFAADANGNFSVRGAGSLSCAEVVKRVDAQSPDVSALVAWADGALAMANRGERGTYDIVPFDNPPAVLAVNLCRANPQALYVTAVFRVIEAMKPLRVTRAAAPVSIKVGAASASLRPETLRLVQNRLRDLKLLTKAADGKWGAPTREAIKQFQQSQKLPVTEVPDPDTVIRLILPR